MNQSTIKQCFQFSFVQNNNSLTVNSTVLAITIHRPSQIQNVLAKATQKKQYLVGVQNKVAALGVVNVPLSGGGAGVQ